MLFFVFFCWVLDVSKGEDLSVHGLFTTHAVLPVGKAPVWGHAKEGTEVTVSYGGETVTTMSDGRWLATLKTQATTEGQNLTIETEKTTIVLEDVVSGPLWLCSGQSNMEFEVKDMYGASELIATAGKNVRLFKVPEHKAETPQTAVDGQWQLAEDGAKDFSAVCYATAPKDGVIGLVESAVGGTPIEAWMSSEALEVAGEPRDPTTTACPGASRNNSNLFNAMIHNLLPMPFAVTLWYQGEANVDCPFPYGPAFKALINDWRALFNASMPFLFVQLAAYGDADLNSTDRGTALPQLRLEQNQALILPGVEMAVAIDRGEHPHDCDPPSSLVDEDQSYSPGGIHPCNKSAVARRLQIALQDVLSNVGTSRPYVAHAETNGTTVTLHFANAEDGVLVDTEACTVCCAGDTPFELAINGKWVLADVIDLHNGTVVLEPQSSEPSSRLASRLISRSLVGSSLPTSVRYASQSFPQCVLSNGNDLTASPFLMSLV